jgi:hypothetical protein
MNNSKNKKSVRKYNNTIKKKNKLNSRKNIKSSKGGSRKKVSRKNIKSAKGGSRKKVSRKNIKSSRGGSRKNLLKRNSKKNVIHLKGGSRKKVSRKNIKTRSKQLKKKSSRKKSLNKKGGNQFRGIVQILQDDEYLLEEKNSKKFNNKVCSPHIDSNNTQFTCFSHDSLKKIAKAYNKNYEKQDFDMNNKVLLWEQIRNSLNDQCGENEVCWKNQDFVKELNDEQIDEFTFKPKIPKKKYEWLKTSDINKVLVQFQKKHKDFLFLGTVPIDFDELFKEFKKINVNELLNNGITKLGVVFNLDPHWKGGSHWVCMFAELPKSIEYFDSYGDRNDLDGNAPEEIQVFMNRIFNQIEKKGGSNLKKEKVMKYNKTRHQYANSECGVYSLNYIIERLSGRSFEDITGNITKDESMNKNRKIYFRE